MTFRGAPPEIVDWRDAAAVDLGDPRWARRRAIAVAYDRRESMELLLYAAEAEHQAALRALAAASDEIAQRKARYALRQASTRLLGAWRAARRSHQELVAAWGGAR